MSPEDIKKNAEMLHRAFDQLGFLIGEAYKTSVDLTTEKRKSVFDNEELVESIIGWASKLSDRVGVIIETMPKVKDGIPDLELIRSFLIEGISKYNAARSKE